MPPEVAAVSLRAMVTLWHRWVLEQSFLVRNMFFSGYFLRLSPIQSLKKEINENVVQSYLITTTCVQFLMYEREMKSWIPEIKSWIPWLVSICIWFGVPKHISPSPSEKLYNYALGRPRFPTWGFGLIKSYGVASSSRLLKIIGFFCRI